MALYALNPRNWVGTSRKCFECKMISSSTTAAQHILFSNPNCNNVNQNVNQNTWGIVSLPSNK